MEQAPVIILGTVAIYVTLVVLVAFGPKISRKLITATAAIAVVCGLIFYGMCFASITENPILAILQTCYAVCGLFVGERSVEAIKDAPLMQYDIVNIIFSAIRFLGLFATAGAAVSAIGANFLRRTRLRFWRKRALAVIHPLTPKTLDFARELTEQHKRMVVFVEENPNPSLVQTALELGCVIRSDSAALNASKAFLRSIGAAKGSRKLSLFCISNDHHANRQYAATLRLSLQQRQLYPHQTSLTIFDDEDQTHNALLNTPDRYGFGNVLCVNEAQLAARLLLQKAPVWKTMRFDADCCATEDFHGLVIGSGKVGQAVIRQLVMSGQFTGSRFSLTVIDPRYEAITGRMRHECSELFRRYDIRGCCFDARSQQMYDYLAQNWKQLKYIVVCTGNEESNLEIARQLLHFLTANHSPLPIHICSRRDLRRITADSITRWDIFTHEALCSDQLDRIAIQVNYHYYLESRRGQQAANPSEKLPPLQTPSECWDECNYFNRVSNRAAADFAPAFAYMAGYTDLKALPEVWCNATQLENMARNEHERWCAFHYCMGFRPMTKQEFTERAAIYRQKKAIDPETGYRITKDMGQRIHACLVPWEELDALSAREGAILEEDKNYKENDRINVIVSVSAAKEITKEKKSHE